MTGERWHGTVGGYVNHACRCADCTAASSDYHRAWKARVTSGPLPAHVQHGTTNAYSNYRCRCAECKAAWSEQLRTSRQRKKHNDQVSS